ncbi:NAD(P)H-hydrate epimerase [[Candida] zeylanoides]
MFKTLSAKAAASLDRDLMSTGAFSIDQLMELAGLAVAQAIYRQYPPTAAPTLLVLVGPGNNGGDGLVASRHLKLWGYNPIIYYPKRPANDLYSRLLVQLRDLEVAETDNVESHFDGTAARPSLIVDALFGFSFRPPIRSPFDDVVRFLATAELPPIVSVDIPSGWDVDAGPSAGALDPAMLVSLTAPKPCATHFAAKGKSHYLGGRFISPTIAQKYGIEDIVALYKGDDLVVKL